MKDFGKEILKSGVMNQEQLDKAVADHVSAGARSERSALRKVYREVSQEQLEIKDIEGFWLGEYERRRGGISLYIQTSKKVTNRVTLSESTPPTDTVLKVGDSVRLTNVALMSNRFTGNTWLETGKESQPMLIESENTIVDAATPLNLAENISLIKMDIANVFAVTEFDDGEPGDRLPLLGPQNQANVRLILTDGSSTVSIKLATKAQLRSLAGKDISWLNEDDAIRELADMLIGEEVLAFGTYRSSIGRGREERDVNPYLTVTNFGWVVPISKFVDVVEDDTPVEAPAETSTEELADESAEEQPEPEDDGSGEEED